MCDMTFCQLDKCFVFCCLGGKINFVHMSNNRSMGIIDNSPKQLENKYNCVMISDIEVIFVNEIQFALSKTAVVLRFKDSGS